MKTNINIVDKILNNSNNSKREHKLLLKEEIDNSIKKDITTEKNQKQIRVRNPGIDLGRILDMMSILINHILGGGGFINKFNKYHIILYGLFAAINFHISCFIFISGYIGYKTSKYSNLIYLWFWALFYSISINIYYIKFKPQIYNKPIEILDFFLVSTYQYWYFTTYFGMYLFLPVINKGLEIITKLQLKMTFISFIFFFVVLRDYINPTNDIFKESNGRSVLWFLIFYITGAYFGKFKNENNFRKKQYIYYLIYILIYSITTYLCIKSPFYMVNKNNQNFKDKIKLFIKLCFVARNSSVVQVLQSICIILFLTSIKYNKYIAKIITTIGPLVFSVYLIHVHPIIYYKIFNPHFQNDYSSNLSLSTVLKIVFLKSSQIFIICIIIDYFRNLLFRICQIKKLSILIEKLILKLFSYLS